MNLKNLIREIHDTATLFPSDIFNLFFIEYLYSTEPHLFKTDYGEFILQTYPTALKKKYVTVFKQLLVDQLHKYASRKRTDSDFNTTAITPKASASILWDLMKHTFRSDMSRRNTVWELIAEYTTRLEQSSSLKDTFTYINMLNNCIHNVPESILWKLPNGEKLFRAFELVSKATSISQYEKFVDKDLRQLKSQSSH